MIIYVGAETGNGTVNRNTCNTEIYDCFRCQPVIGTRSILEVKGCVCAVRIDLGIESCRAGGDSVCRDGGNNRRTNHIPNFLDN